MPRRSQEDDGVTDLKLAPIKRSKEISKQTQQQ
jgi:hypothetical protein